MKQEKECLKTHQREIIKGVLKGQTYEEILNNEKIYMNLTNIKKNMSKKVYPVLTNALRKKYGSSIKVGKRNLVSILDSYYKQYNKEEQSAPLANLLQINNLKLGILNKLENEIKQWEVEQKDNYAELIKVYWLELNELNKEASKKIYNKNLEKIFELLIDQETSTIIHLLTSIAQDKRVERYIRNWFETIIEELKQVFTISEEEFQDWTVNPIRPERIDMVHTSNISTTLTYTEHCLILKIKASDNKSINSGQYAIEDAHFLPDVPYPPTKEDYIHLNKEIQEYKNKKTEQKQQKEYYSIEEIKPLLTQLIEITSQIPINIRSVLTIYFFCEKELLSTNFDCWQCEFFGDDSTLKDLYQIRVRCIDRLNPGYLQTKCKKQWDDKWNLVKQQFNPSDEGKTWKNLCRSNSVDLNPLFLKLLKLGIPIAIWSRYDQKYEDHSQEINNLVLNCEGNVQNLPEIIGDRRKIDSDDDDDLENLGHHLSLLWEDPNLIPPFVSLTSGHLSQ
ncbi:hypothetical protein [Crocosphaera sp.]|uniref:VMAP-C domain-containing protein n=1 Tax=Crocosphaera sp. TaxID=2729996 RepID=UPI002628DAE0|nr:hypothetical protein [Crocosphaera sp.]MDJ0582931.1 hypothetical protein [Crocosphaera sp.]